MEHIAVRENHYIEDLKGFSLGFVGYDREEEHPYVFYVDHEYVYLNSKELKEIAEFIEGFEK